VVARSDEHPFTAVDEQEDPGVWIAVLDTVGREPAYVTYKRRAAELLRPHAAGRYLDVGVGTGADALALAAELGCEVVGVDASEAMVAEARTRGLRDALVADAHALPFEDASFDGCRADRVFQHLADPDAALAELVRVTKPGGRIVIADPDYGTQVVSVDDQDVARRVFEWRAQRLRNGTLAHRLAARLVATGLVDVHAEGVPIVLRDPTALDNALGLRDWATFAHADGFLTADEVPRWQRQLDDAAAAGRFLYSFCIFITAATKP
jgi:SAM-dependent methyltransferase